MNDHEAQRIAAAMHEMRPDWPTNSLLTLLRKQLIDKPRRDVAVALAWIACESNTATPARVLESGPWWKAAGIEGGASQRRTFDPNVNCTVCAKPNDGRHPEDHVFESETDRLRRLAHDADTERIEKAKDWARQGIYGAKEAAPTLPEPEPLPSLPEVDRLRMLHGAVVAAKGDVDATNGPRAQLGGRPDAPAESVEAESAVAS